jgi:hypothetical protein
MNRSIAIILTALMGVTVVTVLAGCGSDDEKSARTTIPKSRLTPARQRAELSPEEQKEWDERQAQLVENVMMWPEDQGPPRDAVADSAVCRKKLLASAKLRNANPLIQLTWTTRCMADKGWVLDPDARKNQMR